MLVAFFDKVGDKWKNYTGDESLAIEGITALFNKYQDPSKGDNILGAIKEV